jgi:hypothetical protein
MRSVGHEAALFSGEWRPPQSLTSLSELYDILLARIVGFAIGRLDITVEKEDLFDHLALYVASPYADRSAVLLIDQSLDAATSVYTLIHMAAHVILGHADRSCATIVEPRRCRRQWTTRLDDWELRQGQDADVLVNSIIWGDAGEIRRGVLNLSSKTQRDERDESVRAAIDLSKLLLGHRHRGWRGACTNTVARRTMARALRYVSSVTRGSPVRAVRRYEHSVGALREVRLLTEIMSISWEFGLDIQRA